ncbi:MAG: DUF896 domain-containing protein [Firmicutes bacterium]|nr:DUF896 domain-containing protein [Bacillota bacterium]
MQELVKRINELAAVDKQRGLTEEEKTEREKLRKEYVKRFREGFKKNILDNMYIVDEEGNKKKVVKGKKR